MTLSRSLFGRISFWWAAGFVVLGLTVWLRARHGAPGSTGHGASDALADMFYVRAHLIVFAVLGGAAALFAIAYLALEGFRRGPHRRLLGGIHFAATAIGTVLLLPSVALLAFGVLPARSAEVETALHAWTVVAGAGYGLTLAAQLFFVAVIIDAFRREPDPR